MEAFRHQNVKKLISHQKYLFWSITISKCGIAIHPVNRQHQDFNMESKSNQKYAILNWSINHISRKLNLIYDIDFVVQHIKAEGEWIAISYANWQTAHSFWQTNSLSSNSPLLGWDGMWGYGGRIPKLGNKSHLSSLAFPSKCQLFSFWQHLVREHYYYYQNGVDHYYY